jgi:hypothetical protein
MLATPMKQIEVHPMLDAAATTLINHRCRRAHLHDLRGGLQAIAGAVELLARLARAGKSDPVLVDRASAIAKSALANHETAIVEMLKQAVPEDEVADAVNFGELIDETLRFLRNDFASKQIKLSIGRCDDLEVRTQKHKLRLLLLGLFTLRIDDCPSAAELAIRLERSDGNAVFALSSPADTHLPDSSSTPRPRELLPPRALVLEWACNWLSRHGARMELRAEHAGRSEIRVYYPLHVAVPEAPAAV